MTTTTTQDSELRTSSLLALNHLTLLLGEPGIGKSLLALDLAARLSQNLCFPPSPPALPSLLTPDLSPQPLHFPDENPPFTVICSREDPEHIIKDRLLAAGAYLGHIQIYDASLEKPEPKEHPRDEADRIIHARLAPLIAHLYDLARDKVNTRLLILDPLPAFLDRLDCTHPATIRKTLSPLLNACQSLGISLLAISHLNKSPRAKTPLQRSLGSSIYPALARKVYLLTHYHPDSHLNPYPYPNPIPNPNLNPNLNPNPNFDPSPTLLLLPLKSNYHSPSHAHPLSIISPNPTPIPPSIPPHILPPIPPHIPSSIPPGIPPSNDLETPTNSPSLYWHPPLPLSSLPPDLQSNPFSTPSLPDPYTKSQLELALDFLQTLLARGPVPSRHLRSQAAEIGISLRTLNRARYLLQVKPHRHPDTNMWLAALPAHAPKLQESYVTNYADNI